MKVVIFGSGDALKNLYWEDDSIIFFDERGWWLRDGSIRSNVKPETISENVKLDKGKNIIDLIVKLRLWGPTFERWCGKGDRYELLLREALILSLQIGNGIRRLNIKYCIMHTGVSHHVDSVIFQTACNLVDIEMIFLYHEVINSRLLPLRQKGGLDTRKPMAESVSNFDYEEVIEEFLKNKEKNNPPKNNIIVGGVGKHFGLSLARLLYLDARYLWRHILDLFSIENDSDIFAKFSIRYPFQLTEQAFRQRRALSHLTKKVRGVNYFKDISSKSKSIILIIAAHNQPEATSYTEGGDWGNHLDIALELFRLGYKGVLAYKEHKAISLYFEGKVPTRVGMARSVKYYELLQAAGCEFLEAEMSLSLNPAENYWYLPVTITGTIAIERSLAGYHTIVTGQPWFKGLPGTLQLSEIDSLELINPKWVMPNAALATAAREFINNLLSGMTITNHPGIGSGVPELGHYNRDNFEVEFGAMLGRLSG